MFNLQGSEIIIVLLLALVVLGPEKLPDAMRKMGQAYAELKKMSSGFQNEFRAAVDEPLRELRETANVLRDSADFTKLQDGERQEKPKSGEMGPLAPADPDAVPTADVPTFDTVPDDADGPELTAGSKAAPFADEPAELTPSGPRPLPATPPPFTGMSSTAPRETDGAASSAPSIAPSTEANADDAVDSGAPESSGEELPDAVVTPPDDEADATR